MRFARHILLRFNHGVEIGAYKAYVGHFARTGDNEVYKIAQEEVEHRQAIKEILAEYGLKPFWLFDWYFIIVGSIIQKLCMIAPLFTLDFVAKTMEMFAVINYTQLSRLYPEHEYQFLMMARAENRHEEYFSGL